MHNNKELQYRNQSKQLLCRENRSRQCRLTFGETSQVQKMTQSKTGTLIRHCPHIHCFGKRTAERRLTKVETVQLYDTNLKNGPRTEGSGRTAPRCKRQF